MKKKLLKFFIIIGALALLLTLISTTGVQAAIQSNSNTHETGQKTYGEWMLSFRNMETTGELLGLTETIDTKTMLSTSGSNKLDSHMLRSTEYGAIAILSASGYGNSKKVHESTIKTTTGNTTGVYFCMDKWEWVAGGYAGRIFSGVDARYYDAYTAKQESAKAGDALGTADTPNPGCDRWHDSEGVTWINSTQPYFCRGAYKIFTSGIYAKDDSYLSRGVIVCGDGF